MKIDDATDGAPCDIIDGGLDWIVANVERPAVVNMSYGGVPNCFSTEDAVTRVIGAGIPMIKSAGNNNVDAFQDRGKRPTGLTVVGATDENDGRAFFNATQASNFGPYVALFAPGGFQRTALNTSSTLTRMFNGTSAAAPLAAGAAAGLLEAYSTYSPAQVRSVLVGNAANVTITNGGAGSPNKILYARIP